MAEMTLAQQQALALASARVRMQQSSLEVPGPRRSWSDVPGEALANLPSSTGKFVGGLYEAVTSPVQTVKGILDVGAGALQNITPDFVKNFVNQFDANPDATKRAVDTANAIGGMYKQRYGSEEGFKEALATDPVGVISDFSTLFSGGATATAKLAPTVSKGLTTAAKFTNPAAPVAKAVEYGLGMTAKGAGNALDFVQGQRPAVRAGSIVRNALTEEGRTPQNLLAAQLALQNAPAGATVRQALSDVTSPQIQYLGKIVESETAPGATMANTAAQEASRIARLEANTPDLQSSIAARTAGTSPLYAAATQPTIVVNTAPLIQRIDALITSNPGNTKLVSALNQVKAGLQASGTAEQVSSVLDNIKDLIASKDNKFIVRNLNDVKNDISAALPGYAAAQQEFARLSAPVNQAQVLGAMTDVLKSPTGVGERVTPFMTAMGRGEQALIKKSTGEARFHELSDVLTPRQMAVVGDIKGELLRDARVAAQTKAGAEAMQVILDANKSKFRLPDFMSVKVTLANQLLRAMEGKLNKNVMAELEKGFQSGADFSALMKKIPSSERLEVLRALGQVQGQLSPVKMNVLTQARNALAPQQENVNALAP